LHWRAAVCSCSLRAASCYAASSSPSVIK
jgi:hypothetical protein